MEMFLTLLLLLLTVPLTIESVLAIYDRYKKQETTS